MRWGGALTCDVASGFGAGGGGRCSDAAHAIPRAPGHMEQAQGFPPVWVRSCRVTLAAELLGAERAIKGSIICGVGPLVLRQLAGTPEPLLTVPAEVGYNCRCRRGRACRLPIRCDAVVQLPHTHWRMHGYGVSGSGVARDLRFARGSPGSASDRLRVLLRRRLVKQTITINRFCVRFVKPITCERWRPAVNFAGGYVCPSSGPRETHDFRNCNL